MNYKIKDLPIDERPREKLKIKTPTSLSNEELIAIILRSGTKDESVKDLAIRLVKGLNSFHDLSTITYHDLIKIKGIKDAKAITLLASIELGKRLASKSDDKKLKIKTAEDIFFLLRYQIKGLKQEKLFAIFLNTKNELIGYETIFIGTQNKSITHPREIFYAAIKNSAVKIMLVHNHPTGDVTPSKEDILFTTNIKEIASLMKIPLIDHIIISENTYFSFFDHELL